MKGNITLGVLFVQMHVPGQSILLAVLGFDVEPKKTKKKTDSPSARVNYAEKGLPGNQAYPISSTEWPCHPGHPPPRGKLYTNARFDL